MFLLLFQILGNWFIFQDTSISDNTVGVTVLETCRTIWDSLQETHMKIPTNEDTVSVVNEF
jgi:hypothetical protein